MLMYAYALATTTFATAVGHYSRASTPISGIIADGPLRHPLSPRASRPGTSRSVFAWHPPGHAGINHSGSLLADLWKWRNARRWDSTAAATPADDNAGMFIADRGCTGVVKGLHPLWNSDGTCCLKILHFYTYNGAEASGTWAWFGG